MNADELKDGSAIPSQTAPTEGVTIHERSLMRRLDSRILPPLIMVYLLSFIDRVNIGNALLFGLRQELAISSNEYSTALSVFFVSYALFEIPANVLMKKVRHPIFLSTMVFTFGLLVLCQGFCQNLSSLIAIRFLLGAVEAGTLPGCLYVLSTWYRREQSLRRFTFFFMGGSLSGAFGGLLASAIGKLDYYNGHRGWRYIFWLEGGATCLLALLGFFVMPDFPEFSRWVTPEEREVIVARLAEQQGNSKYDEPITIRALMKCLNWRMLPVSLAFFGPTVVLYGMAYFTPSIVSTFGYSPITSQLYSVPPWVATFVYSMAIAYLSDRYRQRFVFTIFTMVLSISAAAALTLLKLREQNDSRYALLCLYLMGAFTGGPLLACWNAMNITGHLPRAVALALQIGVGNTAGIVSAWTFPESEGPRYLRGYYVAIGCLAGSCFFSTVHYFILRQEIAHRKGEGREPLYL